MKSIKRVIWLFLMIFLTMSLFSGCKEKQKTEEEKTENETTEDIIGEGVIRINDDGLAEWKSIEGAKKYNVDVVYWDGCPVLDYTKVITETSFQLEKGYSIQVAPVFEDGTMGEIMESEYYGGKQLPDKFAATLGLEYKSIAEEMIADFPEWEVVSNIDMSSVQKGSDGMTYFSATGPDGKPVRFCGIDTDVTEEGIILHKQARLVSLDSIGRIYGLGVNVSDSGNANNWITWFGGYNVNMDPHPENLDGMIYTGGFGVCASDMVNDDSHLCEFSNLQPNFIGIGSNDMNHALDDGENVDDMVVSEFRIKYEASSGCTPFRELFLSEDDYGAYIEGEHYDPEKERFDPYNGIFDFRLFAIPELDHPEMRATYENMKKWDSNQFCAYATEGGYYEVKGLKDSSGNKLDMETARLKPGDTLTVSLGNKEYDVPLYVLRTFNTADTMHDLVPYAFPSAVGDLNILVVPIAWKDEPQNATDKELELFRNNLGRVKDDSGKVKDYSDNLTDKRFSLSQYFDIASYGKFNIVSYMTDWYQAPYDFSEYKKNNIDKNFINEVRTWLSETYPDKDWSEFDLDNNGYFDMIVFLNAGDMSGEDGFTIISFGGAYYYRTTYGNELAGDSSMPGVNGYVNMNSSHFEDNTMIHEFSHGLGLIDYYDVTYSGRDAVGGYDMQSGSFGDWNPYSKYSVGWIDPQMVSGLKSGESVEIEIGSFAETGDSIVIPAAGDDMSNPFSEYMLVDLFTPTGVNQYDAENYGIGDVNGVRIYHVDARMEYRDFVSNDYPDMTPCPIGTIHYANDFKETGYYNLELIQAGGTNTFTNPEKSDRANITAEDFFKAGDEFTVQKYGEFFKDDKFDNGEDFGYSIKVESISGSGKDAKAVIKITKQ